MSNSQVSNYTLQYGKMEKVDGCTNNPCRNGGSCYLTLTGQQFCICPADYDGDECQIFKAKSCDDSPCQNGGTCRVDSGILF